MKKRISVLIALATFVLGVGLGARYTPYHPNLTLPNAQNDSVDREISQPRRQVLPLPEPARPDSEGTGLLEGPQPEAASDGPTPEELSVIRELKSRPRAGEYVLASDNPFVVRKWREHVERATEAVLPSIISARQDVLSRLGVEQENIAKLTNHAARIAEASSALMPLLGELATAKIDYDLKARQLLSSEQYQKFREFETRQVLETEWKRFGVDGLENLPFTDVAAIMRSMQELGIRETHSSTILPYEPEPASGMINGQEADQYMLNKIAKLDAAARNVNEVAELNDLSSEARKALGAMIENRVRSLREEMARMAGLDEEHRARVSELAR